MLFHTITTTYMHTNSIKIKTRSVLASNDRISIGGRVFIFNNAGSTTKVCAKAVHVREVSPATQKSVEKDLFGQLSLVQTNGSQEGAVVKIRGTMTIGRYVSIKSNTGIHLSSTTEL